MPEQKSTTVTGIVEATEIDAALERAPVIHVDGGHGIAVVNNLVRFNLTEDLLKPFSVTPGVAPDGKDLLKRVVCARLVMTPKAFVEIADWLSKFVDESGLRTSDVSGDDK